MQELAEHIHRLAKAELHVHLEGTADAAALREMLLARNATVPAGLDRLFVHQDFRGFLHNFRGVLDLLVCAEDYGWLAGRYLFTANISLSPALIGVGYIVGLNIAVLVFMGGVIGTIIGVPVNWLVSHEAIMTAVGIDPSL